MSLSSKELLDKIKDKVAIDANGWREWDHVPLIDQNRLWPIVCERYATEKAKELLPKEKKEPESAYKEGDKPEPCAYEEECQHPACNCGPSIIPLNKECPKCRTKDFASCHSMYCPVRKSVESSEPHEKGKIIIEGVTEWTPVESQEELWNEIIKIVCRHALKLNSDSDAIKEITGKFSITRLTPLTMEKPFEQFLNTLRSHRLKYTLEDYDQETGISMLDRLTPSTDDDITRGLEETELLADELWNTHVVPLHEELKSTVDEKWEVISDADKTIKQLQADNKLLREEILELDVKINQIECYNKVLQSEIQALKDEL